MGLIDTTAKALRLLISRRFTSNALTNQQEAFTSTLDINSGEIYTQEYLIPSTGLPFSGSSQNGQEYENVLKYWYRQKLTKSNLETEVWFFLSPTGSNAGVTPQIIQSNQQVNFISSKYSSPVLTNANAEDATPGYNVVVYKSTSLDSGSLTGASRVSVNDYQFDYKTGVLQFDQNIPSSNEYVYITAYQYIGKTLSSDVNLGIFRQTGSFYSTTNDLKITGSLQLSLDGVEDYFSVEVNGEEKFKVNTEGVVELDPFDITPTAVTGGLFYSGSDEYYLGFRN